MQLGVREVARLLGVPERVVYRWIKDQGIPHSKVHEQVRFNRVEVLEWATRKGIAVSPEIVHTPEDGEPLPALADAIEAGGVHHGIAGHDKKEALRSLVSVLPLPAGVDREFVHAVLMARENAGSTGMGGGIAIPHVRNPVVLGLDRAQVALGYLAQPVDFGAVDGKPVFALFALFSPSVRAHLRLLSRLAFLLRGEPLRQALERRAGQAEILAVVRAEEAKLNASRRGAAAGTPAPE
jgi:PTS system nitrogen regulatory IIA component